MSSARTMTAEWEERLIFQSRVARAEHEPAERPCVKEGLTDLTGLRAAPRDASRSREEILSPCSNTGEATHEALGPVLPSAEETQTHWRESK